MVTNETQEQLEARGWDFTEEFIPDEPTVNNQDKTVDVSENGTIEVTPDEGFTGLGNVTINTDVSTVNNQDKTVDVSENGTIEVTPDEDFTGLGKVTINTNVEGAKPKWTGHADAEGLRAIGWTDEDIAYYQENGVNWNEEDDEWHKVTEDNKALYGVLTASNISKYRERIVYLPKIDTSGVTSMNSMFYGCSSLTAIPMLDTSGVTDMNQMFMECSSLKSIPPLDTSNITNMYRMFYNCHSLTTIPELNTSKVTAMIDTFSGCFSLVFVPQLNTSNVTRIEKMFHGCSSLTAIPMLDTSGVTAMNQMFMECSSLIYVPMLDISEATNVSSMFYSCYSLTHVNLKNVKLAYQLNNSALLSKESLLYLINNEAATAAITIKLASYAYDRWVTDPDIVAALANHPNISLAK